MAFRKLVKKVGGVYRKVTRDTGGGVFKRVVVEVGHEGDCICCGEGGVCIICNPSALVLAIEGITNCTFVHPLNGKTYHLVTDITGTYTPTFIHTDFSDDAHTECRFDMTISATVQDNGGTHGVSLNIAFTFYQSGAETWVQLGIAWQTPGDFANNVFFALKSSIYPANPDSGEDFPEADWFCGDIVFTNQISCAPGFFLNNVCEDGTITLSIVA